MKNLLFVESPLQLLNAYEASKYFKLKNSKFIIRLSGSNNSDKQILNLIDILDIDKNSIEYIRINTSNRTFKDIIHLLIYFVKYIFIKYDRVFIGNYDSKFFKIIMKQFKRDKIILLDDGAKSLYIQKKFTNRYNFNLFTIYNLKSLKEQKIYKNRYNEIKNSLRYESIDNNTILFLGMKLSEIGIIDEDYYIDLLNKISKIYKNKSILYITHRGEKESKLEKISKIKNIDIIYLNYPIELYGLYSNSMPYKIISFYSTAVYTMKYIYNIEVECYNFNYSDSIYKDIIDEVYSYYKKYIKVIDLND